MENSMSTDTKQTCMRQTCMARQFHNGLMADYEGMMRGELGKLWDGKLVVRAEADAVVAMFDDGSWYARAGACSDRYYIIAKDDVALAERLESLNQADPKLAGKLLDLIEAWRLEAAQREAAEFTNSMRRR